LKHVIISGYLVFIITSHYFQAVKLQTAYTCQSIL